MSSLAFFALVLAVVGGAIAHIGDRLGTYVGKKRMSVIGLRPRQTATLYTIGSGGAISLLTLLVLVGVDHSFKRALLEGPQLLYQNTEYRHQIKIEEARAIADAARAQASTAQLQQVQGELGPIQQQLTAAQVLLKRSQVTLQQRQDQLAAAQAGLGRTDAQLRAARNDVAQTKASLAYAQASVRLARSDVRGEQARVRTLTSQGRQLVAYNARIQHDLLPVLPRIQTSMQGDLIYRPGQEVGRVVIAADQPVTTIERQLSTFLADLSRAAEAQGGSPNRNNGRAVVVALPATPTGDEAQDIPRREQAALRVLAQNIAEKANAIPGVVVLAVAKYNTFRGEQVGIALHPYDNVLVYPKGTVVAAQTVDGTQGELQIITALHDFLVGQVRPAVRQQGLIPQTDPQTGQPVVGAIDDQTSRSLVQQIEQTGADARVTAYASEDTYSSGPLHLRLSVSPAAVLAPRAAGGGAHS